MTNTIEQCKTNQEKWIKDLSNQCTIEMRLQYALIEYECCGWQGGGRKTLVVNCRWTCDGLGYGTNGFQWVVGWILVEGC